MTMCNAQFVDPSDQDHVACCDSDATSRVGHLLLCPAHTAQALGGLLEYHGLVAAAGVIQDVSARPDLFPNGVFQWAAGMSAVAL